MSKQVRNQGELSFPPRPGGKRKGAGRKPRGEKAGVSHSTRLVVKPHTPVFVTTKVMAGLPSLRSEETRGVIQGVVREVSQEKRFRIVHFTIQEDHLHLVVETFTAETLRYGMSRFVIRVAKRVNKVWGRRGTFWKERYHARPFQSRREAWNVLRYCLNNGRKHGVWKSRSQPDPYSSGRWFDGWSDGRCEPRTESCPVAAPSTWLLRIGWRKYGLLALTSAPAA